VSVTDVSSDPCEKCGAPVFGYVEQRCCDGRECGCMGMPIWPCWCDACWQEYTKQAEEHAALMHEANL
jgi:hypothetical protein